MSERWVGDWLQTTGGAPASGGPASAPAAPDALGLRAKRNVVAFLGVLFLVSLLIVAQVESSHKLADPAASAVVSGDNRPCVACHAEKTPSIVRQWQGSRHATLGVGCLECHVAEEDDVDGYVHEGKRIATIVTPNDCGRCHEKETTEFLASHHARAGEILGSLDNVLGKFVEGTPALVGGCQQCHGSKVALLRDEAGEVRRDATGRPLIDPTTWPNTGMGRINLDGSRGTCSACHSRHAFTAAVSRRPENCGKCHMGPDHPQIEIYEESKHGIAFHAHEEQMNLEGKSWVVGVDYDQAPTCATCHMSATRNQPVTHDVGARISWTLRPVISKKLERWEERRDAMKDVCMACHAPSFTDAFYEQYDGAVDLYNEKFARPAQKLMVALRERGLLTPIEFDEELEWIFFRLWHHEGRRARMGASMMGPDYTQWHGFFEVAETFYTKFLPEVEHLATGHPEVEKLLEEVSSSPDHAWRSGLDPAARERIDRFYQERYGGKPGH